MTAAAIGVFAAAARRATNPTAARNGDGTAKIRASAAPLVAPTKKSGVTMPPEPPLSSVIEVARIFSANARSATRAVPASVPSIVSTPSPDYESPASR